MSSRMPRLVLSLLPERGAHFEAAPVCDLPAEVAGSTPSLLDRLQQKLSSDEALVARLQGGNPDALTVLFERHSSLLFAIARRILRNDAEAEDAVQQIFLDVFRSIHQFNPDKGRFKTWLLMFAYQRAFNCRRSLIASRFFESESLDEVLPQLLLRPENFPGYSIVELGVFIEQALGRLNPRQRQAIEMIYYEGLTAEEVSVRTRQTVRVVRHNLYRGLEKLRKSFAAHPLTPNVISKGGPR